MTIINQLIENIILSMEPYKTEDPVESTKNNAVLGKQRGKP